MKTYKSKIYFLKIVLLYSSSPKDADILEIRNLGERLANTTWLACNIFSFPLPEYPVNKKNVEPSEYGGFSSSQRILFLIADEKGDVDLVK